MINAALAVTDGVVDSHATSNPQRRIPRPWQCHVSVRVRHSVPLLAAGLLATLRQIPGYDVALADTPSSAQHLTSSRAHVLITDRRSELEQPDRRFLRAQGGCRPRPRVILLSNEPPLAARQNTRPGAVDVYLPLDCPTDELLAAVCQLGQSAFGPLATYLGKGTTFERPARGGLAPGVLRRVLSHIESHLTDGVNLQALARLASVSCCHFSRAFKRSMGMPAHQYIITRRISAAIALIRETDRALSEISLEVGFADQSHFSRTFVHLTGVTPGDFRHRSH